MQARAYKCAEKNSDSSKMQVQSGWVYIRIHQDYYIIVLERKTAYVMNTRMSPIRALKYYYAL